MGLAFSKKMGFITNTRSCFNLNSISQNHQDKHRGAAALRDCVAETCEDCDRGASVEAPLIAYKNIQNMLVNVVPVCYTCYVVGWTQEGV